MRDQVLKDLDAILS